MAKICAKTFSAWLAFAFVFACVGLVSAQAQNVAVVNAAHFFKDGGTGTTANSGIVTPDGLASAFGVFNITAGQSFYAATPGQALPKVLGGVRITINGTDADLLFVRGDQINFVIPANAPTGGNQTITVTNANSTTTTGVVQIEAFAPGLFSARADGTGVAAANWTPDGSQPYPSVYQFNGSQFVHNNISVGTPTRPSYLILYATGVRRAPDTVANGTGNVAESVTVTIQGLSAQVEYAGPQGFFAGLDQINVVLPPALAGVGIVNVRVAVKNATTTRNSNAVEIKLGTGTGSDLAPITIRKNLNLAGETVTGTLLTGDDIEINTNSSSAYFRELYYIDVYSFTTTAPNTSVTIDLRGDPAATTPLDTNIILRKLSGDGNSQSFVASDDNGGDIRTGGFGANNNSLMFANLPEAGTYWIFVTSSDAKPLDTGAYTLRFATNTLTPIAYGQTLNGTINSSKAQTAAGVYVDGFYFTGTEGETVQITMRSTAFDSFLILNDQNGDYLTLNDNGAGGTDAQISFRLPMVASLPTTRTFYILATPLEANRTGAFTLALARSASLIDGAAPMMAPFSVPNRVTPEMMKDLRRSGQNSMFRRAIEREQ